MTFLDLLKPAVPRRTLFFVAAGIWFLAGAILLYRGTQLLPGKTLLLAVGLCGGLLFFRLVFLRISNRHITRIRVIPHARPCLFSFLDWRGYGLMTLMITGGVLVRTSGILPASVLGTFFVGMGTPLVVSSVRFAAAGLFLTGDAS